MLQKGAMASCIAFQLFYLLLVLKSAIQLYLSSCSVQFLFELS
jgi:hypothetical protein